MLPSWCMTEVTRIRPASQTVRGAVIPDWSKATTGKIDGCSCQWQSTTGTPARNRVNPTASTLTIHMPPGADIARGDAVEVDGVRWLVDGEPETWTSPTGAVTHVFVTCKAWKG